MRSNNNCQFLDRSRQCRLFAVLLLPHLAMAAGLRSPADGHASGPVAVEESGNSITIGNDYLERTLSIDGSRLRTSKFINKLSHHTYSLSGPEFQIELIDEGPNAVNPLQLTTQDFKVVDHVVEKEAQDHLDPLVRNAAENDTARLPDSVLNDSGVQACLVQFRAHPDSPDRHIGSHIV
jgi:hypothetical protein